MATFLFQPTPHTEAVAAIAGKPALTRAQFDKLLPELKAYAFTISGVQSFDVLQDIRDQIATLPAGGDWDQIKGTVSEQLIPYFVDPAESEEVQQKQRDAADRRAELLIRTHGSQAYAATAYRLADAQRDLFPYWQYQTLGDSHVRESHAALDGLVLPANHPFWAGHTPPWDWGCRCQFIPLTADDVAEMKQQDEGQPPEKQRVLDEEQLKLIEEQHTVWRPANLADGTGHPVPYSVASPAERGQENPFTWQPSHSLIPKMEDLQSRYDAQTWATFQKWAEKTEVPGQGRTIMDWLNTRPEEPTGIPAAVAAAKETVDAAPRWRPRHTPAEPAARDTVAAPAQPAAPWKPRAVSDAELTDMMTALDKLRGTPPPATAVPGVEQVPPSHDAATRRFIAQSEDINRREQAASDRLNAITTIYRNEHPEGNRSEEIARWSLAQRRKIQAQFEAERRKLA